MKKLAIVCAIVVVLASAGAAGGYVLKTIGIKKGDVVVLKGTSLGCAAETASDLTCVKADARGGIPGSYAVSITNTAVIVTRFDSQRKSHVVFSKKHGA